MAVAGCESATIGQQSFAIVAEDVLRADGVSAIRDGANDVVLAPQIVLPLRRGEPVVDLGLRLVDSARGDPLPLGEIESDSALTFDRETFAQMRGGVPILRGRLQCVGQFERFYPNGGSFAGGNRLTFADCAMQISRSTNGQYVVGSIVRMAIVMRSRESFQNGGFARDWFLQDDTRRVIERLALGLDVLVLGTPLDERVFKVDRIALLRGDTLETAFCAHRGGDHVELQIFCATTIMAVISRTCALACGPGIFGLLVEGTRR